MREYVLRPTTPRMEAGCDAAAWAIDMKQRLQRPARLYLLHAGLLTFGLAINGLFFNLAIPALGYRITFLGLLNSIGMLASTLLALPIWWLVTRVIGVQWALLASATLNSVALLTVALWPQAIPLLIGTALSGPAAVLFQISAAPFMMRHSSATERDFLFSLNAGINIGVAGLGSLVGGFLPGLAAQLFALPPQSAAAYRVTFAVAGLCVLLAIIPLLFVRGVNLRPATRTRLTERPLPPVVASNWFARCLAYVPEPWRSMLRRPWPVIRFTLPPLVISFGAALLIPYLNLYFRQRYAVADSTLGIIFAAISIATGAATLAAPWFSARFGKMGSVALTQTLAIPCLLALGFAPLLAIAVLVAILRNTLMNMASPLYDAYAMEQSDEVLRPTVIGLINGAYSVGYIIAPRISTQVQEWYGFTPLFIATAICYTLAALLTYLLFVRHERQVLTQGFN